MTNREQAKMNRNLGCCTFLDDNFAIFEDDAAMVSACNKMKTDCAAAFKSSTDMEADNTGYSADKVDAKKVVCELASKLCGNAQIRMLELDNKTLYNMLHSTKKYYFDVADALTSSRLQFAKNVMGANLIQITADYVTAEQLVDFQTKIDKYNSFTSISTNVNKTSKTITAQFKKELKLTSTDINIIKTLVKNFKETQVEFFEGVLENCKTPTVKVLHTNVSITIIDANSGKKLEMVSGSLSNSKQLPVSNKLGVMNYARVKRGKAMATFKLDGFVEQSKEIRILVGKDNKFVVKMVVR